TLWRWWRTAWAALPASSGTAASTRSTESCESVMGWVSRGCDARGHGLLQEAQDALPGSLVRMRVVGGRAARSAATARHRGRIAELRGRHVGEQDRVACT